jgi:hypothetical protein
VWTSAKRTGKIKAEGPQSRQNSTTFYPYDDIPAACGPIFGQSASAAALETGGRGLFSGSPGQLLNRLEFSRCCKNTDFGGEDLHDAHSAANDSGALRHMWLAHAF